MNINTIVKTAYAVQAGCALALAGIGIYAAKQQLKIETSIAESTQQIAESNKMMNDFMSRIK